MLDIWTTWDQKSKYPEIANNPVNLDKEVVSEIRNFSSSFIRYEMKEIDELYKNSPESSKDALINEADLLKFFESVKSTFHELSNTQFHLLFDDAGQPHIPIEVQNILGIKFKFMFPFKLN